MQSLDVTPLLPYIYVNPEGGGFMTKETVLKDYPGIPVDADLAYFLFFMGRSIV